MASNSALKIGDYITLKSIPHNAYISVEGLFSEQIYVDSDVLNFDNHLFCVHYRRQYSASREVESFLKTYNISDEGQEDPSVSKYLTALRKGCVNEDKLNDAYMDEKLGKNVVFGDVIQLYHVKSKKYLKIIPDKLALDERENLSVVLHSAGDVNSWLQILPRFKIDREGDVIQSNNEIILKVIERNSEYIHCADRYPKQGSHREVNCSVEMSSWKMSIFQSSLDMLDQTQLLASELVRIYDSETLYPLTIPRQQDNPEDAYLDDDEKKYLHKHGNLILRPSIKESIDSGGLWLLESKRLVVGGPIQWKTESVRLRHMNSKLYIHYSVETKVNEETGIAEECHIFSSTNDPSLPGTLFSVQELNSKRNVLTNEKAISISHNGIYLQRDDTLPDMSFGVSGVDDQSKALNLIIERYSEHRVDENKMPLNINIGIAACNYLRKYADDIVIPHTMNVVTVWPTAKAADIDFFYHVIMCVERFISGFNVSDSVNLDIVQGDPKVVLARQKLAREQGLIDMLLAIVRNLVPLSIKSEKVGIGTVKSTEHIQQLLLMGSDILSSCFTILIKCMKDNAENELYMADSMHILLLHLSYHPLAGKCVTSMLSNNMDLQETKIGTREVSIFVDKLRTSKFNSMYLQLLQSCCSCQGNGVDGNQCKIANMLFSASASDVLVTIVPDYSTLKPISLPPSQLFLSNASPILGGKLLTDGVPQLKLNWRTEFFELTPLAVCGVVQPTLEQVFKIKNANPSFAKQLKSIGSSSRLSSKRHSTASSVRSDTDKIAEYIVAEMFLVAEMCMDRNYVAINKLDLYFPYDVLVTILQANVTVAVKSAAMRILLCLHVDRDPQASSRIPSLSRTWSSVQSIQLPCVSPDQSNKFGIIQQFIADHLSSMSGSNWTELSKHTLNMLRSLITFNFYGTTDRLNSVILPLLQALDRRDIIFGAAPKMKPTASVSKGLSTKRIAIVDNQKDESAVEGTTAKPVDRWEKRWYEWLQSLPVMCSVLLLVLVAVIVTVYQVITGVDDSPGTGLYIWGICVLCAFILEISLRCVCYCRYKGTLVKFAKKFFNQIDIVVILIDIIFLVLPSGSGSGASFTKILRLVRMARLLRVLRAARVVSRLVDLSKRTPKWVLPTRYSKAPIFELNTMVDAVGILLFIQKVIEDRNLSLFVKYFHSHYTGNEVTTPKQLFERVIDNSTELTLNVAGGQFEQIMIDILMFDSSTLTQCALECLMTHYSTRSTLINNVTRIQLMISNKREHQYKQMYDILMKLEQNAETHELWGELETPEHHETSKQTIEMLEILTQSCRTRRTVLELGVDYSPDREMQILYRNLGCFDISLKLLGLIDSIEESDIDGGDAGEVGENTRRLIVLCNSLLYWFFIDNPDNQQLGYDNLTYWIDTLDNRIDSHVVIKGIFSNNENLMKLLEHSYLQRLSDRIVKGGKKPQYLTLFASITNVGDRNVVANQFEIMKCLTSPGRLENVGLFFVPVDHPDYDKKRKLMKDFIEENEKRPLALDELPDLLAYHLALVEVMANCTVGRLNITTVEAKVQSVFNYTAVIDSVLQDDTILVAKIKMSLFLFNAVIEVEMRIPGLEQMGCVWRLLESYVSVLQYAKDSIRQVEKLGWGSILINRQKIEYIICCIMITGGFFTRYYSPASFRLDDGTVNKDKIHLNINQINELIVALFGLIKDIYDLDSNCLAITHKQYMFSALEALNRSISKGVILQKLDQAHGLITDSETSDIEPTQEMLVSTMFNDFVCSIRGDESISSSAMNEISGFVKLLEAMPYISDQVISAIRYEAFIVKLVSHMHTSIVYVNDEKRMDPASSKTAAWIMRAFRLMVENKMGMSIEDRDDDGGEEQDIAAAPVIQALNKCGATALCLDLIAVGIDSELQMECIKLCVGLLYKEGGAVEVQSLMHKHLTTSKSSYFFRQLRVSIQKLIEWHKWKGIEYLEEGSDVDLPEEILIIRFMQLMCEGHYLPNQDIFREQTSNITTINLLDDLIRYLNALGKIPCKTSTSAAIRVSATVLEVIQGPCTENQKHFALNTELLETLNRLMRSKAPPGADNDPADEVELKKIGIDIYQGLLEGQNVKSQVYERLLSVLHLDIIQMLAIFEEEVIPSDDGDASTATDGTDAIDEADLPKRLVSYTEGEVTLKSECMVLLKMLCDFKPNIRDELDLLPIGNNPYSKDVIVAQTASVEIMWRGELQRRFFKIPDVCMNLSKSSKDALVEFVDRTNLENKLLDFLARSHELYREVKHQQMLEDLGVAFIFSPSVKDKATWISFYLAIIMNLLFLIFYHRMNGDITLNTAVHTATTVLNVIQAIVAAFVLVLNLVVRTPIVYQSLQAADISGVALIVYTIVDPMTLYYCWYLTFSIFGIIVADFFVPILLLDVIVKNTTTQNVLNAVILPRKQLAMALLLGLFVMYIYAFYIFLFFRADTTYDGDCDTLFGCFKLVFVYGLRSGGGISDLMHHTVSSPYVFTYFSFYLCVTIVLLNIIFGIIIDTFGELRDKKTERLLDTAGICFICGIDSQTLDRASKEPEGFKLHITHDHSMWNYLYFIFFLWEQDKDDDDGMEQFVRRAIDDEDISWFPMNKAMKLRQMVTSTEILQGELLHNLEDKKKHMLHKIHAIESDLSTYTNVLKNVIGSETSGPVSVKNALAVSFKRAENGLNILSRMKTGIDDDDVDNNANKDDDSEVSSDDRSLGRHVFLQVDKVLLSDTPSVKINLACRILCEADMYQIPNISGDEKSIIFESDTCVVCENAVFNDYRSCRIQILRSLAGTAAAKFVANFELTTDELIAAGDIPIVREFVLDDNGVEISCEIYLNASSDAATTYGIHSDENEEETDV